MNPLRIPLLILALSSAALMPACDKHGEEHEEHHEEQHKIVVTSPVAQDVVSTQQYVCQIHSRRHIEVRALDTGYLEEIRIQEGQSVKKGETMFRILPVLYQASLDTEKADAELAQIKYDNTKLLSQKSIVSQQELALAKAELARARAKVTRARAELNFASLTAPFDGIVDRQYQQQGSLVEEGDILSTLSDNEVMWVYFNVPEARYLEYKARLAEEKDAFDIELQLANGEVFKYPGKIGAIEADFNNETGNIAFRADFPNPDNLLRHGQTGTILIHRKLHDAIVIPQRATYEILAKKYVYVVEPHGSPAAQHDGKQVAKADHEHGEEHEHGEKHGSETAAKDEHEHGEHAEKHGEHAEKHSEHSGVVRQREIVIGDEMDDIYVITKGLKVTDKIIFEGIRQVRDGDEVEYELRPSEQILSQLKFHAE
jgi:membrane fusion protein (multidrug efflux system)